MYIRGRTNVSFVERVLDLSEEVRSHPVSNDTRKEKRKGPGQRTLLHVKHGDKAVRVGEIPLVKFAKEASLIGSSLLGVRVAPLFLALLVLANMQLSMPAPNMEG